MWVNNNILYYKHISSKHKTSAQHLYNAGPAQRHRRWSNIAQRPHKCFAFIVYN